MQPSSSPSRPEAPSADRACALQRPGRGARAAAALLVVAVAVCAQNPIVVENQLPGVAPSVWYVPGAGDANIQGFATDFSVNRGETVRFKIDTDATAYHIDVYRLGWYQGNGARLVGSGVVTAMLPQLQPVPIFDPATAMTDCGNWAESAHWDVPATAVSGIHVAKLMRDDATPGTSLVLFVVRDDASTSDLVFQTADETWHAYNLYGGASLYPAGGGAPGFNHATKVSYNRPFDIRNSSGGPGYDVFSAQYAMVRWLEANGYDVSYVGGVDVDRNGAVLLQHRLFVSTGHDEYWSGPQRAAVTAARDAGVHLAFFSGNEVYWKTRYEPSIDGSATPHRTLVCYKEGTLGENGCGTKCDPSPEWTGLWRDGCAPTYDPNTNGACRPESTLTGQLSWNGAIGAIEVPDTYRDLRFWRNTGIASLLPGQTATLAAESLGHEWDPQMDGAPYPPRRILLSRTVLAGLVHHLSLYRADSGALVFGAGTVQWSWGLDDFHTFNPVATNVDMQQATVNLLADMGIAPGSLQPGLVPATGSSDTTPPTSLLASPANGATVPLNGTVVVQGIAADSGGGVVAGVEVSADGGATWLAATGTTTWSYVFAPAALGPVTIQCRAFDDTGNLEVPGAGNTVMLTVTPAQCPCTVFPATEVPLAPKSNDGGGIEPGMKFRVDVPGQITALRYYKPVGTTGVHIGNLWSAGGTLLASATFVGETASGWQQVPLSPPVPVVAGATYVVSYFSPSGDYVATQQYFTAAAGAGSVHGLADGVDGPNGVYVYATASTFPTQGFMANNYWADVVFDEVGDTTPPTVVTTAPLAGATGVPIGTVVTVTFSEALDPATVSGATFELRDAGNLPVPATVAYTPGATVVRLVPSSPLAHASSYTATVRGDTGGPSIADPSGNRLASDFVWSFTTAAPTAGPFAVFAPTTTFSGPPFNDGGQAIELGMRFRAEVDGAIVALRYFKAAGTTGAHVGSVWTNAGVLLAQQPFVVETPSGWQEVALAPPLSIVAGTTYVVSYHSSSGDYAATTGFFTQTVGDNLVRGLADGLDGPNGVYQYSPTPTFPTQTFNSANYYADVVFYAAVPDTAPPVVLAQSPAPGATGVATNAVVSAMFDEALAPSTVSNATFELLGPLNTPVAATVAYDAGTHTATLTPAAPLAAMATYTATLRGGATAPHVTDASGNPLAADVVWSFATVPGVACPCTVFASGEGPTTPRSNDLMPIELGMKFRTDIDGVVTALRYFKPDGTTGLHVGSLWTSGGVSLAQVPFDNETASGWQQVLLPSPVPITAGTTYVVSYFSPSGDYVSTIGGLAATAGAGLVHGLADGVDGPNGVYVYSGAPTFPTDSFMASNYWADVVFWASDQARAEHFGAGCAGTGGLVPVLSAVGMPPQPIQPNPTFGLALADARPFAPAVIGAGDLLLGTAACSLLIGDIGPTWGVVVNSGGGATVPLPIPATPAFTGLAIWLQAAVVDPAASASFVPGLALTQGLRLSIGN